MTKVSLINLNIPRDGDLGRICLLKDGVSDQRVLYAVTKRSLYALVEAIQAITADGHGESWLCMK